jgi:hypothetical protein
LNGPKQEALINVGTNDLIVQEGKALEASLKAFSHLGLLQGEQKPTY